MSDIKHPNGHHPNSVATQFKKGHTKSTGRQVGSKNRKTLRNELLEKGGLTPAEFLHSVMLDENANTNQRMAAADKLLGYTESKLQSLEVTGQLDTETSFTFFMGLAEEAEETMEALEGDSEETTEDGSVETLGDSKDPVE